MLCLLTKTKGVIIIKRLTLSLLEDINKNYDYNYNKETLQSIYNELTLTESVNISDIIEEFESV